MNSAVASSRAFAVFAVNSLAAVPRLTAAAKPLPSKIAKIDRRSMCAPIVLNSTSSSPRAGVLMVPRVCTRPSRSSAMRGQADQSDVTGLRFGEQRGRHARRYGHSILAVRSRPSGSAAPCVPTDQCEPGRRAGAERADGDGGSDDRDDASEPVDENIAHTRQVFRQGPWNLAPRQPRREEECMLPMQLGQRQLPRQTTRQSHPRQRPTDPL
jgi:hypothetical protein